MSVLFETPFKLTQHEILIGIASNILLQRLKEVGVPEKSVADLCDKPQYGYTASAVSEPIGPRFVRITDIQAGSIDWNTVPYCECNKKSYQLAQDDILIARTGSVGKSFLVKEVPESAVFASYLIRLRTTKEINSEFLYWCFQSQQFWEQILKANRGSAIKNINGKMLSALFFPVPDVATQNAIANFLNGFWNFLKHGDKTGIPQLPPEFAKQQRIVAKIEQLAAKVEEAQTLRNRAKQKIDALSHSSLRQTFTKHSGWKNVALETVCTVIIDCLHSNPIYSEKGIPTVRSPDVGWGKIELKNARKTSEAEYMRRTRRGELQVGDLVLVREGGGTGKAGIVKLNQKFSLGQRVMMLRPNKELVLSKFLLYQWLSPLIFQDQIMERMKGSASPHLNIRALKKFDFLLPPIEEQRRIVAYLDNLQAKVDSLRQFQTQTQTELDALLPSILDKAFKGEL